jgi:hypothetical protein
MTPALLLAVALGCSGKGDASPPPGPSPAAPTAAPVASPAKPPTTPMKAPTDLKSPGEKAAPACKGLSGELSALASGGGDRSLLDGEGRVQVTVEAEPTTKLPSSFDEERRAMGMIQGRVAPEHLCDVAGTDGVRRVRTPHRASPK